MNAMLQVNTEEQGNHVLSILNGNGSGVIKDDEDGMYLDGYITFDQMAEIVDYLRSIDRKDDLFEECWVAYRRKGSKKKAKVYWNKLSDDEKKAVMPHINAYVSSRDLSYQRDFERYLRDKLFQTIVTSGNNVLYDPNDDAVSERSRDDMVLSRFYGVLGDEEARIYGIDEYQWHMMTDRQKDWHRSQPDKRNKLLAWIRERNG